MSVEFLDDREKKVLELEARKRLYQIVRDFAGCHFREIERISALPTGTVKYHLDYLSKFGLIKPVKKDNALRYFPRGLASEHKRLLSLLRQKSVRDGQISIVPLYVLLFKNTSKLYVFLL